MTKLQEFTNYMHNKGYDPETFVLGEHSADMIVLTVEATRLYFDFLEYQRLSDAVMQRRN